MIPLIKSSSNLILLLAKLKIVTIWYEQQLIISIENFLLLAKEKAGFLSLAKENIKLTKPYRTTAYSLTHKPCTNKKDSHLFTKSFHIITQQQQHPNQQHHPLPSVQHQHRWKQIKVSNKIKETVIFYCCWHRESSICLFVSIERNDEQNKLDTMSAIIIKNNSLFNFITYFNLLPSMLVLHRWKRVVLLIQMMLLLCDDVWWICEQMSFFVVCA